MFLSQNAPTGCPRIRAVLPWCSVRWTIAFCLCSVPAGRPTWDLLSEGGFHWDRGQSGPGPRATQSSPGGQALRMWRVGAHLVEAPLDLQSSGGIQIASGKEASVWWCEWWVDPEVGCSPAAHHCLRCTFAPRPLPVPLCPTSPVSSLFPHNLGIAWG